MNENFELKKLISKKKIVRRISGLASQIGHDYSDQAILLIGLLNGSFVFLSDLVRELSQYHLTISVDFMRVASYGSETKSSEKPTLLQDISFHVRKKHVLLVDDILDTGHTLSFVIQYLNAFEPLSVKSCVFLDKPDRRQVNIHADYVGFTVPDVFVVGYGLDYQGRFREMPSISALQLPETVMK